MKKFNKLFALLLALAMIFSLVTPYVLAEEDAEVEDEEAEVLEDEEVEGEEETEAEEDAEAEDAEAEDEEAAEEDEEAAAEKELEEIIDISGDAEQGKVTSMLTMVETPANWNPHTYEQNIEGELMDYLKSNMFEFDYEEGNWTSGYSLIPLMCADIPVDVTADYAGDERYAVPEDATEGYAFKYVLRDDLVWQDGTPINADTYMYSLKELLNPQMLNLRADMLYSGAKVVHNAENYLKQGSDAEMTLKKYATMQGYESVDAFLEEHGDDPAMINWNYSFGEMYKDGEWVEEGFEDAYVDAGVTLNEMRDLFLAKVRDEWGESEETALDYFEQEAAVPYKYPEMDFSEVGFDKTGDLEFVMILDNPLVGFDFYWNCREFYLVYEDLYEKCKQTSEDSDLITSNYGTSIDTTMSYGPYKLVGFQDDKFFDLVRNENWFGWKEERLTEQNQEDRVYYQIVKEPTTRYQMFLKGQLNGYNLQPDEVDEYRGSDYIYYTLEVYTQILNIQSNEEALKARETDGVCRRILTIPEFRQALSWSIDRAAYCKATSASNFPGFGLLGPRYIADPDTMTPYRDYDYAKDALCNAYGIEYGEDKDFATLDEAYDALTGYDLDAARELFDKAYDIAEEKGFIKDGDIVNIVFSFNQDTEVAQRNYNFLNQAWTKAVEGTKLENRLVVEYDPTAGTLYADLFRNGQTDLLLAGWVGALMDPFYLFEVFLNPNYRYAQAFDPEAEKIEIEIAGETYSLTPMDWWTAMMGMDPDHPFGKGKIDEDDRIKILATLEGYVLQDYTACPLNFTASASLKSQRIDYESPDMELHPILGYGYIFYNYDDVEWNDYVAEAGGTLDYH